MPKYSLIRTEELYNQAKESGLLQKKYGGYLTGDWDFDRHYIISQANKENEEAVALTKNLAKKKEIIVEVSIVKDLQYTLNVTSSELRELKKFLHQAEHFEESALTEYLTDTYGCGYPEESYEGTVAPATDTEATINIITYDDKKKNMDVIWSNRG